MARRRDALIDPERAASKLNAARRTLEYAHRFGFVDPVDLDAMGASQLRAYAVEGLRDWPRALRGCAAEVIELLNEIEGGVQR